MVRKKHGCPSREFNRNCRPIRAPYSQSKHTVFTARPLPFHDLLDPKASMDLKNIVMEFELDEGATYKAVGMILERLEKMGASVDGATIIGLGMFLANPFLFAEDIEDLVNTNEQKLRHLENLVRIHRPKLKIYLKEKYKSLAKNFPPWTQVAILNRLSYLSGIPRSQIETHLDINPISEKEFQLTEYLQNRIIYEEYYRFKEKKALRKPKEVLKKIKLDVNEKNEEFIENVQIVLKALFNTKLITTIDQLYELGVPDKTVNQILDYLKNNTSLEIKRRFPTKENIYYRVQRILHLIDEQIITEAEITPVHDLFVNHLMNLFKLQEKTGNVDRFHHGYLSGNLIKFLQTIKDRNISAIKVLDMNNRLYERDSVLKLFVYRIYKDGWGDTRIYETYKYDKQSARNLRNVIKEITSTSIFLAKRTPLVAWVSYSELK